MTGSELHPVLVEERCLGIWGPLLGGLHMRGDAIWQVRVYSQSCLWSKIFDYALNRAKNPEVVERVQRGQILSQPGNCPIKVYEVRPTIKCQYSSAAGDEAVLGDGS